MSQQEPFGYWHVGDTYEDSEFFLRSESGDVSCESCIKLYEKQQPLTDAQLRDVLRECPNDTVESLRIRWLYAKDFARAIEAAHGITGVTK